MKKIILLFLLIGTTISYGQITLANKLKITSNVTSTTATKVNVQEADGIVNTKPLSDFMQLPDIVGKENQFNKQNSLATDGTGVKYSTVDAVNIGIEVKVDKTNTEGPRLESSFTNIYGWGDSLTAGAGGTPYTTVLNTISNFTITNKGAGGETSTQIKNRFIAETSAYSKSVILWVGRNNLLDPTTVKADIATMVNALGHTRYLIVSILNGADEPKNSGVYNSILQLNNDLKSIYGVKFVDVRSYLVNLYPNTQDVIDISLRSDALHLNSLGYQRVAEHLNSKLGILFNQSQYLQSKDFSYYLKNSNTLSGTGTANQISYFTGANSIKGATNFIYNDAMSAVGVGTLPINTSDGSSWFSTGAPLDNAFGGGLISSIAGINQAYFYSSQNHALVRAGINNLSQPMGVKLQVNNGDDAFTVEGNSNAILKRNFGLNTPNSLVLLNTAAGASGIQLGNSSLLANNRWQFFISADPTPIFKIGQDNIGDYLTIRSGGAVAFSSTLAATSYTGGATLTGTPTAPTATLGTNTTQLATTAFVQSTTNSNAVLLAGNQTVTGRKTLNSDNTTTGGITINNSKTTTTVFGDNAGIFINNNGTTGIIIENRGTDGILAKSLNSGNAITIQTFSTGTGLTLRNIGGTGDLLYAELGATRITSSGAFISNNIIATGLLKLKSYTVSTLPTGVQGATAYVTDALSPTYLSIITGGGTVVAPVFYNGVNWVSH